MLRRGLGELSGNIPRQVADVESIFRMIIRLPDVDVASGVIESVYRKFQILVFVIIDFLM